MIEFCAGVAVGYFCRPLVSTVISIITNIWNKYQQKGGSDGTNTPQ